jgi:hypothetical protein
MPGVSAGDAHMSPVYLCPPSVRRYLPVADVGVTPIRWSVTPRKGAPDPCRPGAPATAGSLAVAVRIGRRRVRIRGVRRRGWGLPRHLRRGQHLLLARLRRVVTLGAVPDGVVEHVAVRLVRRRIRVGEVHLSDSAAHACWMGDMGSAVGAPATGVLPGFISVSGISLATAL